MSPVATYLVETLVTLAGVVALAVLVLMAGRRFGLGRPTGPLELVGRLVLDPRRAVYLVKAGKLIYVVAASEGGMVRLGEMNADAVPASTGGAGGGQGFRAVLDRIRGIESGQNDEPPTREAP